jgi:NTP pyrophosphatase (non-canonical NTP hydrolase)
MSAEHNGLPPQLTQAQKYEFIRLKLMEELAEIIHATCKLGRYGFYSVNPNTQRTNAQDLIHECGDGIAMIRVAMRMLGLSDEDIVELVTLGTRKLETDYPELFIPAVKD